jgi:hypothetical protein
MPPAALDEARGGFSFAGYEIEFGILVQSDGAPVRTIVTDLATLHAALEAAGLSADRYPAASVTADGAGLTVIRNAADGVTVAQTVTLDIVIGSMPTGADGAMVRDMVQDLPLPGSFGSF